jgi:pyrimidine deaminase RibD-like protein
LFIVEIYSLLPKTNCSAKPSKSDHKSFLYLANNPCSSCDKDSSCTSIIISSNCVLAVSMSCCSDESNIQSFLTSALSNSDIKSFLFVIETTLEFISSWTVLISKLFWVSP